MRTRLFRVAVYGLILPLTLGFAIASAVGPLQDDPNAVDLSIPTGFNPGDATPTTVTDGVLGLTLSHSAIGFGTVVPGEPSEPFALKVMNTGAAPFALGFSATGLRDPVTGAEIPADRLHVSTDPGRVGPLITEKGALPDLSLSPGHASFVYLTLETPSGAIQWMPSGEYGGTFTVTALEV